MSTLIISFGSVQVSKCEGPDSRQSSIPVAGKTREQVELEFQNRLTRSIPAGGREALALESESAPDTPGVRAMRAKKQASLF